MQLHVVSCKLWMCRFAASASLEIHPQNGDKNRRGYLKQTCNAVRMGIKGAGRASLTTIQGGSPMSQGEAHRHNHRQHTLDSLLTHLHLRRSRKNPLIVEEGAPRTFFDSAKAGIINNIIIRGPGKSLLTAKSGESIGLELGQVLVFLLCN